MGGFLFQEMSRLPLPKGRTNANATPTLLSNYQASTSVSFNTICRSIVSHSCIDDTAACNEFISSENPYRVAKAVQRRALHGHGGKCGT